MTVLKGASWMTCHAGVFAYYLGGAGKNFALLAL